MAQSVNRTRYGRGRKIDGGPASSTYHIYNLTMTSTASRDWAQNIGEFVPLRIERMDHLPQHVAMLVFEDATYHKYYTEPIVLSDAHTIYKWTIGRITGWPLKQEHLLDAIEFVNEYNDYGIPQSDTLEWDSLYDEVNDRVLFYPYFPRRVGQQMHGDTWAGLGCWDDTLRAFVFSPEDWDNYMEFVGYTY